MMAKRTRYKHSVLVIGYFLLAQVQAQPQQPLGPAVAVQAGDRCAVCNTPLQADDTVYLIDGRRVGVMQEMESELLAHPGRYLPWFQPRGGLFGGEADSGATAVAWLAAGLWIVFGLLFAAFCGQRALNTAQPVLPWVLAGLFFNVAAYALLLTRSTGAGVASVRGVRKVPSTLDPIPCPTCGALNHPSGATCLGCGNKLQPSLVSEVTRLSSAAN